MVACHSRSSWLLDRSMEIPPGTQPSDMDNSMKKKKKHELFGVMNNLYVPILKFYNDKAHNVTNDKGRVGCEVNLVMTSHHITSLALRNHYFVGKQEHWVKFERNTCMIYDIVNCWRRYGKVLGYEAKKPTAPQITNDKVKVGCEVTVQGRFQQNVGQVMTTISRPPKSRHGSLI